MPIASETAPPGRPDPSAGRHNHLFGIIGSSTGYSTNCIYFPPESSESDPEPEGGGVDYLTVTTRLGYEYKGKPLNLLEGPLQKRAEAMGETVIHLHGIGTRAEIIEFSSFATGPRPVPAVRIGLSRGLT